MLFLSDHERQAIQALSGKDRLLTDWYWRLYNQAKTFASRPGLVEMSDTNDWWYGCFDRVATAALFCALKPDPQLLAYVRETTLAIVRRPIAEWAGPAFRNFNAEKPNANLETAHLSWAVSAALDLAPDAFTQEERAELMDCLRIRAIPMCRQFLTDAARMNNWHAIITAGLAMAAAVTGDREQLAYSAQRHRVCCALFQPDGSYCESLQYANYAQIGLTLAYEAILRAAPDLAAALTPERYGRGVRWAVASYFFHKPQEGWEAAARARSANFNDSAALFQPTGDVLLHIAVRCQNSAPVEAGLARWFFGQCYRGDAATGPLDLASFGFLNATGFLTLQLLATSPAPLTPQEAGLGAVEHFENGDTLLRDQPEGRTILAVHGGADVPLVNSHAHADLGSFILVHNHERLLADPGHSCYRGAIHFEDYRTRSHNVCTFLRLRTDGSEEECEQRIPPQYRQTPQDEALTPPLPGYSRHLLSTALDELRCTGYELSPAYGTLLHSYRRFYLQHTAGALFLVDCLRSAEEVRPVWNWTLNNHGGLLEYKPLPPDRIVIRRGNAALKLFHLAGGAIGFPRYGFLHDAYHPLPAQQGEGKQGSAYHIRWVLPQAVRECAAIHALAMDSYGMIAGWHLKDASAAGALLESPAKQGYRLDLLSPQELRLHTPEGAYRLASDASDQWRLERL